MEKKQRDKKKFSQLILHFFTEQLEQKHNYWKKILIKYETDLIYGIHKEKDMEMNKQEKRMILIC